MSDLNDNFQESRHTVGALKKVIETIKRDKKVDAQASPPDGGVSEAAEQAAPQMQVKLKAHFAQQSQHQTYREASINFNSIIDEEDRSNHSLTKSLMNQKRQNQELRLQQQDVLS